MQNYKKDCVIYFCCAMLSILFLLWVIPNNMPEYPGYGMPASFLPNVATSLILLLSCLGFIANFLKMNKAKKTKEETIKNVDKQIDNKDEKISWKKYTIFILFLLALIFLLLLPQVGFVISAILLLLGLQLLSGQRKIITIILTTSLPVAVTYALMKFVLNVPIP